MVRSVLSYFLCLTCLSTILSFRVSKILLELCNRYYVVLKILRLGKCLCALPASLLAFYICKTPLKLRKKLLYRFRKMELSNIFLFH